MKRLLWVVLLCVILAGPAGATVSDPNSTKGATCNGSATEFTYLFPAAATTDLSVYLITIATGALGEPLTLGVDYTATCSATGGTVTTTETYSSAYELWIERVTPKTQSLNLVAGGAFNPTLLVAAYDKLTKIVIELYNQQSKFIHVDSREQNVDLELPVPSVRANNYLTFDDDGNVSMTPSEADADVGLWAGVTPTTYFLTLPVAASASALQTLLGLGTIATQAANAVAITGGSVTGITDITVADGGTGASTAAGARINLDAAKKRWIDVTEYPYLATGDGTTDDGTAIAAAIAAAVASGGTVYFPTGVYRVTTDGILYHGETGNYGVSMVGDGPWNSQIYFDPITSDKWLWTHAEVSFVEQFAVFKDLGFFAYSYANSPGADPYYDTIANGFNLNWDANFYFQNCLFRGFERVFKTTGTTGGSGIRLNQCIISHIGEAVLHLDNAQSVDHTFTNCRLTTILGDVIYIDDGGGGQVTLDNCYVNMTNKSGDTDKHWIINGEAGDAVVGSTNNVFNFNELKLEPNSAYSCLFRTAQTNGTAWSYRINVNNSNIRSHTGADRLGVDIDLDTVVRFTNTNFGDWCTFDLTGDSDDICWVFLDKCSLYDGTSDYFTLNSYAGVVAENCTSWTQDSDNMIAFALLEGLTLTDRPMAIKNGDISAGYIDLYEDSDDGTSKMRLITPALAADKEYFMPAADGTDGQVLTTDGAGQWGFETVSGSGDMLASTYDADADGDIDVASGGTEKSTWTQYAIPYLSDTTTFGEIAIGTAGQYLKVSAGATGYEFGTIAGGGDVLADGSVPFASYVDVHATGVRITGDGDGALTLLGLGDGYDEDLTFNLDDTENTVVMSSSTGVTGITLSGIALTGNVTGALTGNADTATLATTVTITDNEDTAENNPLVFVAGGDLDGGNLGLESDGTAYYRPASGIITATGFAGTFTGALTGNATTATSATTATTATVATAVTITDNESDVENNPLVFVAGGDLDGGNLGLESDGTTYYTPSTGVITATGFAGALTGNVTGNVTGSSGSSTGNAATATALATGRAIGGVTFDGTAAITPTTIVVADTTDTTSYVGLWESATGSLLPKTDGGLTYNATTGMLTATGLTGPLTGTASTATVGTTVTITDNEDAVENNPLVFVAGGDLDGGNLGLESDGTTYYTPSTGVITATGFAGALTGAVTGNADTVTTNANLTGDVTSVGNATDITESVLLVGGTDTIFPADPDEDRVLGWDDANSVTAWWEFADVNNDAYNATTWNDNLDAPTKDAVRDALEALPGTGDMTKTIYDVSEDGFVDGNDVVYSAAWNGDVNAPSMNAVYDKIETLAGGHDAVTFDPNATTMFYLSSGQVIEVNLASPTNGRDDALSTSDDIYDWGVAAFLDLTTYDPGGDGVDGNDTAYGAGWNGDVNAPSMNAVYDQIELLGGDMTKAVYDVSEDGFVDGNDVVYSSAWNSDVNSVAMNAIYDYLHQIDSDDDGSIIDEAAVTGAFEAELDNSAGLLAALSDETGTGVAVFGTAPTFTTSITITGADANPTAAGMIVYDSTVTGMSGGGLRWYDDNSIRILVDLETDATDDDYVVAYDADADGFYMKADADTGGSTAYNSIGDPTGAGSISFDDGETGTYTGANDAAVSFITIQNSDADHTVGNMYLLDLDYSADDGDAEADFIKFQDSGSVVMTIQQDGEIATDGGITAGGTITATGSFIIGDADLAEVDMEKLDGITNGTAAANKAVVLDDNGDIAIINSLTASTISDETLKIVGGEILDAVTLEATTTLGIEIGDTQQLVLTDGKLNPTTDNDIDLGDATHEFKDAFFDGTVTSDAFAGPLTGNVTGTADVATEVTVTDNEAEAENDLIPFVANAEAPGANALETDGDFYYTPNTGTVTATIFTAGTSVVTPLIDAAGDEDMDYGSADVDDHTFTSDGGTAILDGQITASAGSGNAAQTLLTLTNTDPASGSETSQTGKIVFNMTGSQNESTYVAKEAARIETYKISDWYASNTEDHDAGLKFYTTNNDTPAVRLTITNTGAATFASTVEASSLTEGGVAVHNNDQMDASSELLAIIDDETGTGVIMFNDSPTLADDVTINAAGVKITGSADGDMTWLGLGNGYDEDLNWNLDDVENTVTVSSTTGVTSLVLTSIALTADVTGALTGNANTATLASTVTYANNDATDENNAIVFLPGGDLDGGNLAPEVDGDFHYNPSTGTVTATEFVGGGVGITGVTAAHTGTITWGGTAILETGEAFQFGDATDATLTHTYGNTGTNVSIAYSTGAMAVTGDLTATNLSGSNTGDNTTATAAAADTIDAITEIAAALKSGSDTTLVTGTKGTSAYISQWNADGDLVDGIALSTVGVSTGDTWTGDHDFGGADLELPQGQTPDTDGDVDLDFTDGKLVVQHGSAHAELSASTDVVMGSLIQSVGGTIISPDLVNDVFTVMPVNAIQFPHGITITAVWLQVASNTTYVLPVQNFDDFDTINPDNGTIDTVTYTADTTGEVTDTTPTYATIGPGQLVMISLPTTDVDWISFRIYYFEPITSP